MMMSITHRITGAALFFGTIFLAMWLIAVASGPHYYEFVNKMFSSAVGRFILLGYTWALIHHMLGGIRHFIWDTGNGFGLRSVEVMAWLNLLLSIALTFAVWSVGYLVRGG
jgi:succinate dehydrogenase / fumarate reductase cytochrome b subunit